MKLKTFIASITVLLGCLTANAQTDSTVTKIIEENHKVIESKTNSQDFYHHEIRLGIGEGFSDRVAFPDTPHRSYAALPSDVSFLEEHNHRYLPHLFTEYNWTPKGSRWGFGALADFFAFDWDDVTYKGGSDTPDKVEHQHCINVALMGHIRYRWNKNADRWQVYSALHVGFDINTGSETDIYGRKTEVGLAFAPTVLGISRSWGHFVVALETGAHFALKDSGNVYSALSKLVTFSAGYRF